MRANRILIPLLIVATLTYDLVLVSSITERNRWPDMLVATLLGLAAGQVTLATFWGVLGRDHLPWRIAMPMIVPLAWSVAILLTQGKVFPAYRAPLEVAVRLLMQSASLALILVPIRWHGARLLHSDSTTIAPPLHRGQFSLRYLFAWMTAAAVTLALFKTIFQHVETIEPFLPGPKYLFVDAAGILLGLTVAGLVLDTHSPKTRFVAALSVGVPTVCILLALGFPVSRVRAQHTLWLALGIYSAIAFAVLRIAGFRIVWASAQKTDSVSLSPK